jgi:hypothetical protein
MTPEQQDTADRARAALASSAERAAEHGNDYEVGYLRQTIKQLLSLIDELTREGGTS